MLFLEKIYSPEEQRERANKALPNYYPRLLAASSIKKETYSTNKAFKYSETTDGTR
jgi:hypothetical protein